MHQPPKALESGDRISPAALQKFNAADLLAQAMEWPDPPAPPIDASGDASKAALLAQLEALQIHQAHGKLKRVAPILKRAAAAIREERFRDGVDLALKALDIDETNASANHLCAIALEKLGALRLALDLYERALAFDPHAPEIYSNLGLVAWRLDMLPAAERFMRIFCRLQPDSDDGVNNLAGILRDQGRYEDAIELLRQRIYLVPDRPLLWNSLGTVLVESGAPDKALVFFDEAIRISNRFGRAFHNKGYALINLERFAEAEASLDQAVERAEIESDRMEMLYARAEAILAQGDLMRGFEAYDVRLDPKYPSATKFEIAAPRWSGEDFRAKRVLLMAEQGLGDEILFLNAAADLINAIGPEGQLFIAVEPRLVPLIQRSFPAAKVGPHVTAKNHQGARRGAPFTAEAGLDLWIPTASAIAAMRRKVSDFPTDQAGFLKADPDRISYWRDRLQDLGPGPYVGLSWKSQLMGGKRAKYYSPWDAWRPVLETRNVRFINLQYGAADDDIKSAQARFGVRIESLDGLDIKKDLDEVAALCCALDLLISPMNATANIAAACGAACFITTSSKPWTFLGQDGLPWYPQARLFSPKTFGDWTSVMRDIADALKSQLAPSGRLR